MADAKISRSTAYKVSISSILNSPYVKEEGWTPNYIVFGDKQISRVNIIGTVVREKSEEKTISIDDGTGIIDLREFDTDLLDKVKLGDIILVIGKIKEYNSTKYIIPEIVKKTEKNWLKVRLVELKKSDNLPQPVPKKEVEKQPTKEIKKVETGIEEEVVEEIGQTKTVCDYIEKNDKGEGVEIEKIIADLDIKEELIDELLKSGDLFIVKPGKVKVLS